MELMNFKEELFCLEQQNSIGKRKECLVQTISFQVIRENSRESVAAFMTQHK